MSPEFMRLVFYPYINYLIFLAIIIYFARKPLREYFSNLFKSFKEKTQTAQNAFDQAEKAHQQTLARMNNLDQEINDMKLAAEKSSELEVQKIKAHAEQLSIHLSKETKRIAEAEMNEAAATLREEMIKSVMAKVEASIEKKIGADAQSGVLDSAITNFKNVKKNQRV